MCVCGRGGAGVRQACNVALAAGFAASVFAFHADGLTLLRDVVALGAAKVVDQVHAPLPPPLPTPTRIEKRVLEVATKAQIRQPALKGACRWYW